MVRTLSYFLNGDIILGISLYIYFYPLTWVECYTMLHQVFPPGSLSSRHSFVHPGRCRHLLGPIKVREFWSPETPRNHHAGVQRSQRSRKMGRPVDVNTRNIRRLNWLNHKKKGG
jgi:hypothetical protein